MATIYPPSSTTTVTVNNGDKAVLLSDRTIDVAAGSSVEMLAGSSNTEFVNYGLVTASGAAVRANGTTGRISNLGTITGQINGSLETAKTYNSISITNYDTLSVSGVCAPRPFSLTG